MRVGLDEKSPLSLRRGAGDDQRHLTKAGQRSIPIPKRGGWGHLLASAYTRPMPQPRARRQAAMVVPVVITLSTKYSGRSWMGPPVRKMACCATVRPGSPRIRRLEDDSTG